MPSNGAVTLRVAEIDRGDRDAGLIVLDLGLVGIALGAGLVDLRLRGKVALAQGGLPVELGLAPEPGRPGSPPALACACCNCA